jgi:hypothetical protein
MNTEFIEQMCCLFLLLPDLLGFCCRLFLLVIPQLMGISANDNL